MNISVCITVLNEERAVSKLLDSLLAQFKKPDLIIFVDGGSTDKTVEIIRHYQRKDGRIKLLVEPCSRARGRNLAISIARDGIIVMTDAGCAADKDWITNITEPFATGRVDVSAGFYRMVRETPFQKAESVYLGVSPKHFNFNFLPSTRSIAFTKKIWEAVGGFPEGITGAAEDTVFNYKLLKNMAKFSRVKSAIVEWGMPENLWEFYLKIYNYAKGDAKSNIWKMPLNNYTSHNIKALSVLLRYALGFSLLIFSFKFHFLLAYLLICIVIYLIWSFRKIYLEFGSWRVSIWGPVLQITSDIGVMKGFLSAILG